MGDTDEPVCDFFTVDLSSGCIDIEDEDKCEADPSCKYIKASGKRHVFRFQPPPDGWMLRLLESCAASVTGQAFHTLSSSKKTIKDMKKAMKKCGAVKTEKACKAIGI